MSESMQMRTTQEQSGNYQVFATATVGGDQPIKGFAVHEDIAGQLDASYIEATFDSEGAVELVPDKATSATIRFESANGPAVRHVYVSPDFLDQLGDFEFEGEDTDLSEVPSLAVTDISASSEDSYEQEKEDRSSAEEAADALLSGSEQDDSDSDESEADDSDEEESDEEVAISDDELGIAE